MISHLLKERMMNCWYDFSKNLANLKKHFDLRSRAFEARSFSAESTQSAPRVALFGNIEVKLPEKICVKTTPYWFDSSNRPKFGPLARRLSVDVLIVGGGVTGILAGYLLKKAGSRVALLERRRISTRDTGHTTAHLTCVTAKRLHELVRDFGCDQVRRKEETRPREWILDQLRSGRAGDEQSFAW